MIPTMITITGIQKLFSGEANKDFSPLTSQWEDFVLDTLQHKAVLKVLPHNLEDHTDCYNDNHQADHDDNNDDNNDNDHNNDQITERGTEAAAVTTGVQWLAIIIIIIISNIFTITIKTIVIRLMAPFLNITFDRPFFLFIYDALNKVL